MAIEHKMVGGRVLFTDSMHLKAYIFTREIVKVGTRRIYGRIKPSRSDRS